MNALINPEMEQALIDAARPILEKGRKGDWAHTRRTIEYARALLQDEAGEADIVIPALYLHDTGWSAIDYQDFIDATPARKKETRSLGLHMKEGARIADGILRDLRYAPAQRSRIVSIIAVHDEPENILALNDLSATLVMEADRLDRYGRRSVKRYEDMFGPDYFKKAAWQEGLAMRRDGLKEWFKTPTAKLLSREMAAQIGLFDEETS
ncbi:MAG: metal-dependent phosphohydrolase [Deltaproteobacteria bacterium]|nr:MAG: metal-dependent phosphohydrolase [Deltaproteobacteria bacterium]